jgi:hypothetical protein
MGVHAMKSFRDSNEASWRRFIRECIRKSGLTKSEQAVTLALVNVWFHHKAKGEMHPGREKIAKASRTSVRTVAHTLAMLRDAGCLIPISHEHGGGKSTRYRFKLVALAVFCGAKLPDWIEGELVPVCVQNSPVPEAKIARRTRAKIAHGLKDVPMGKIAVSQGRAKARPHLRLVKGNSDA